ncbi:MAG: O-antigen ligase family protein [Gammaproteobacteria bacterium]|nr:O-antigen ligase family protein [Gammaproteobacteria bacterium]
MSFIANNIKNVDLYLLPLAAFFLLISSAGTNFFIVISVIISCIYVIKNKDYNVIVEKNTLKLCFAIFLLFLISSFYTIANPEEVLGTLKKYLKFLYIPFIYYLIKIKKNEIIIINFFIYGVTLILVLSYLKYFNVIDFNYLYDFLSQVKLTNVQDKIINTRSSIFQNYIIQGIIFSFYSFLCLYVAKKNTSLLYYLLSLLSLCNILFINDSRAAYILIIILAALSLYRIITQNKYRVIILIVFTASLSTQISSNFENRVTRIVDSANLISENNYNSSLGKRYIWAQIAGRNFLNSPILGLGVGSYQESVINYFKDSSPSNFDIYVTNNPHNEFLSINSQLGAFGSILFLGILVSLLRYSKNNIFAQGITVVVIVSSIFNSAFYDNMLGLFLIIIIGLLYNTNKNFKV